ncbi:MAG: hypothetical protein JST92_09995 [Deltaproteobacteria bacterium]|nr:hypothetical protein [Deltaproteobacteria bacterium]
MAKAWPFLALVALALCALAYDASVQARLPSTEDWADVAGALRSRVQPHDAVLPWPPWLERSRLVIDAAPVEIEEDLAAADFVGVERLWMLELASSPYSGLSAARQKLLARGATAGEPLRFGALTLEPFTLHEPALAADLTGASLDAQRPEFHEVDYIAYRCKQVPIGSAGAPYRLELRGAAGTQVHLRAGVIGETAYADRPPVEVELREAGATLARLSIPRTLLRTHGWLHADAPVPAGAPERVFELFTSSTDPQRPLCVAAWTTR